MRGPTPSIAANASSSAAARLPRLGKRSATSSAVWAPTCRMPSPYTSRPSDACFEPSMPAIARAADFFPSLMAPGISASRAAVRENRSSGVRTHPSSTSLPASPAPSPARPPRPAPIRSTKRRRATRNASVRSTPGGAAGADSNAGSRPPPVPASSADVSGARRERHASSNRRRWAGSARNASIASASRRRMPPARAGASGAGSARRARSGIAWATRSAVFGPRPGMPSACSTRAGPSAACTRARCSVNAAARAAPRAVSFSRSASSSARNP